jgi:hypothetical protein
VTFVTFVQETTVFREFGPLAGNTMRLAYEVAPRIGNTLSHQTVDQRGSSAFRKSRFQVWIGYDF